MEIGLLDFGVRDRSLNSLLRVNDLMKYACDADELHYSRLWLGEHHIKLKAHTWSSPTVLLPILANMTEKIRIGVAGVLLAIHEPYHVATDYKLMANLFGGRIDLGLANGGVMPEVAELATGKQGLNTPKAFAENLEKLFLVLRDEEGLFESGTVMPPYKGILPDVWCLSANMGKALDRALEYKTNLSRSIFHTGSDKEFHKEKMIEFREKYFLRYGIYPKINLVFSGVCHKTEAKAQNAASSLREGFEYNLIGPPSLFRDTLYGYRQDYGIDEMIFMNTALKPKDRAIGIELLADVMQLGQNSLTARQVA